MERITFNVDDSQAVQEAIICAGEYLLAQCSEDDWATTGLEGIIRLRPQPVEDYAHGHDYYHADGLCTETFYVRADILETPQPLRDRDSWCLHIAASDQTAVDGDNEVNFRKLSIRHKHSPNGLKRGTRVASSVKEYRRPYELAEIVFSYPGPGRKHLLHSGRDLDLAAPGFTVGGETYASVSEAREAMAAKSGNRFRPLTKVRDFGD